MPSLSLFLAIASSMASLATTSAWPLAEKRAAASACISDNFEPVTTVGNVSGTPFCESTFGTKYLPINSLTTWSDDFYIYGIQATYSDGTVSPVHGSNESSLQGKTITVDYAHDNFTVLNLYQYPNAPYINTLYIETASGKTLTAGLPTYFFPTEHPQVIGTGFLYGINGTTNPDNIISLGFEFLNSVIESVDVSDLLFTNLPIGDEDITIQTVDTGQFQNNQSSTPENWTFQNSHSVTTTYTFELSVTESFTAAESITISGDVPMVTGGSTTAFTWGISATESFTVAYAVENTLQWDISGANAPGHGVACIATYGQGKGNFPFNSTVTVNLQNGKSFSFEEIGVLQVNDASNVQAECSDYIINGGNPNHRRLEHSYDVTYPELHGERY